MQPVRRHGGHGVECRTQGFGDEFETVEHTDRREHVRGVGALLPARLEQAQGTAALQQLVEEELFSAARQQAGPEFTQDRKVKAGIRQLET